MPLTLVVCYALNATQCFAVEVERSRPGLAGCLYGGAVPNRRDGADLMFKGVRCDDGIVGIAWGFAPAAR